MSIELKMCPFCGGRAVMKAVNKEYGFTIWCQVWNNRAESANETAEGGEAS